MTASQPTLHPCAVCGDLSAGYGRRTGKGPNAYEWRCRKHVWPGFLPGDRGATSAAKPGKERSAQQQQGSLL